MHPRDLSIEDFTYDLPSEKIALFSANPRDSSRLLIYRDGLVAEDIYRHIDQFLPQNSVLVFNDTRVIKSRIFFEKPTGAVIEIFCLGPFGEFTDYDSLFQQTHTVLWTCMIGKAGKWKEKKLDKKIFVHGTEVTLTASLVEKLPDAYVVRFSWEPGHFSFAEVIGAAGAIPLPPYIKRPADKKDEIAYQTVYSEHEGSVAAPTAGLHFTTAMLKAFQQKGLSCLFTTLHVGAGTFKPVKSDTMDGHLMHAEWQAITIPFLEALLSNIDKKIISVGTTATRTLESIFWMGNKILNREGISVDQLKISQWEAYEPQPVHSRKEAVAALIEFIKAMDRDHLMIETEIIIAPGYVYRMTEGLVTNFHQPKSTLLLLVAALIGDGWRKVYDYALTHDFRFLSYGDGCLLLP
jgi:S-adenosylmethionine:tRNA ribosyltransferase-isomerase